eukprot:TRINITY_DN46877_c0_g1_i1.p1 TRINITY_DN46877_c0_g1~~TRINITY_DN46877_c0_g1_i1.p1  ORF type:complete len:654 (-),score=38.06 TRINITY_DN46877_c0_g1_i1:115-2076(-)
MATMGDHRRPYTSAAARVRQERDRVAHSVLQGSPGTNTVSLSHTLPLGQTPPPRTTGSSVSRPPRTSNVSPFSPPSAAPASAAVPSDRRGRRQSVTFAPPVVGGTSISPSRTGGGNGAPLESPLPAPLGASTTAAYVQMATGSGGMSPSKATAGAFASRMARGAFTAQRNVGNMSPHLGAGEAAALSCEEGAALRGGGSLTPGMSPSSRRAPFRSDGACSDGVPFSLEDAVSEGGLGSAAACDGRWPPPASARHGDPAADPKETSAGARSLSSIHASPFASSAHADTHGQPYGPLFSRSVPLPAPRTAGPGMRTGGLAVVGAQTGEPRLVQPIGSRRPVTVPAPPSAVGAGPSAGAVGVSANTVNLERELKRLRQRLQASHAENAKLQQSLKDRGKEVSTLHKRIDELKAEVAAAASAQGACGELEKEMMGLQKDLQASKGATEAVEVKLAQTTETLTETQRQRDVFLADVKTARAEAERARTAHSEIEAALKARISALESAAATSAVTANEARAATSVSVRRVEEGLAVAQRQLVAAKQEAAHSAAELRNVSQHVDRFRDFVLRLCRPEFPVCRLADPNASAATGRAAAGSELRLVHMDVDGGGNVTSDGRVVVPLALLVEGYGLLTDEDRRHYASQYRSSSTSSLVDASTT